MTFTCLFACEFAFFWFGFLLKESKLTEKEIEIKFRL